MARGDSWGTRHVFLWVLQPSVLGERALSGPLKRSGLEARTPGTEGGRGGQAGKGLRSRIPAWSSCSEQAKMLNRSSENLWQVRHAHILM